MSRSELQAPTVVPSCVKQRSGIRVRLLSSAPPLPTISTGYGPNNSQESSFLQATGYCHTLGSSLAVGAQVHVAGPPWPPGSGRQTGGWAAGGLQNGCSAATTQHPASKPGQAAWNQTPARLPHAHLPASCSLPGTHAGRQRALQRPPFARQAAPTDINSQAPAAVPQQELQQAYKAAGSGLKESSAVRAIEAESAKLRDSEPAGCNRLPCVGRPSLTGGAASEQQALKGVAFVPKNFSEDKAPYSSKAVRGVDTFQQDGAETSQEEGQQARNAGGGEQQAATAAKQSGDNVSADQVQNALEERRLSGRSSGTSGSLCVSTGVEAQPGASQVTQGAGKHGTRRADMLVKFSQRELGRAEAALRLAQQSLTTAQSQNAASGQRLTKILTAPDMSAKQWIAVTPHGNRKGPENLAALLSTLIQAPDNYGDGVTASSLRLENSLSGFSCPAIRHPKYGLARGAFADFLRWEAAVKAAVKSCDSSQVQVDAMKANLAAATSAQALLRWSQTPWHKSVESARATSQSWQRTLQEAKAAKTDFTPGSQARGLELELADFARQWRDAEQDTHWCYLDVDGQRQGPFTVRLLRHWQEAGHLLAHTEVFQVDHADQPLQLKEVLAGRQPKAGACAGRLCDSLPPHQQQVFQAVIAQLRAKLQAFAKEDAITILKDRVRVMLDDSSLLEQAHTARQAERLERRRKAEEAERLRRAQETKEAERLRRAQEAEEAEQLRRAEEEARALRRDQEAVKREQRQAARDQKEDERAARNTALAAAAALRQERAAAQAAHKAALEGSTRSLSPEEASSSESDSTADDSDFAPSGQKRARSNKRSAPRMRTPAAESSDDTPISERAAGRASAASAVDASPSADSITSVPPEKRPRGRPRKISKPAAVECEFSFLESSSFKSSLEISVPAEERPVGRARKQAKAAATVERNSLESSSEAASALPGKRGSARLKRLRRQATDAPVAAAGSPKKQRRAGPGKKPAAEPPESARELTPEPAARVLRRSHRAREALAGKARSVQEDPRESGEDPGCARLRTQEQACKASKLAARKVAVVVRSGTEAVGGGAAGGAVVAPAAVAGRASRRGERLPPSDINWSLLKTRTKDLRFGQSKVHAWGLFAQQAIAPDDFVIEYVGELIRASLEDIREAQYTCAGLDSSYLFRIDREWVVDATKRGGEARFINHSCEPNCRTKIITVDGRKHIAIYSNRAIAPGTELTYDYKFAIEEDHKAIACTCGAATCRGRLN